MTNGVWHRHHDLRCTTIWIASCSGLESKACLLLIVACSLSFCLVLAFGGLVFLVEGKSHAIRSVLTPCSRAECLLSIEMLWRGFSSCALFLQRYSPPQFLDYFRQFEGRLDCYVLCPTPSYVRKPPEQMTSLRSYLRFVQPHCALGMLKTVRTWKSNRMIYLTPRSGRFDLPEIVIAKPTWSFTLFCSRNGRITLAGLSSLYEILRSITSF